MDTKKWYQSKTILAGVISVAVAVYNAAIGALQVNFGIHLPAIPEFVFGILAAFGIYGRTTANTKIG